MQKNVPFEGGATQPPQPLKMKPSGEELARLCKRDTEKYFRISIYDPTFIMFFQDFCAMEGSREPYLGALRAVVQPILLETIPQDARLVVEMGAGRGFVSRKLLPEQLKGPWRQFEIDTGLIETAEREYGFKIRYGNAYERVVESGSADAWVGYSSYDSISFLEPAFERVMEALKPGGVVCLIQDVMPPLPPAFDYYRYHLGDRPVEVKRFGGPCGVAQEIYKNGKPIDLLSDLDERVAEALQNVGLTPVKQAVEAGAHIGPREARHEVKVGGVIRAGMQTVHTGIPETMISRNYNIWDRGTHNEFDTFEIGKNASPTTYQEEVFQMLRRFGADVDGFFESQRPPGWRERVMGWRSRKPKEEPPKLTQQSWLVTPERPAVIIPQNVLEANGYVQELAAVSITIAKKG